MCWIELSWFKLSWVWQSCCFYDCSHSNVNAFLMFAKKNEYLGDLAQECRCCCEVSETILIIVVVSAGKKLWPFYCSLPLSLYVEIGQWSIVVRLAIVRSPRIWEGDFWQRLTSTSPQWSLALRPFEEQPSKLRGKGTQNEYVKPVLRAFLHAKSADLLFLNNHKIPWLMYMICYCLFQSELGLNQLQRTKISKKFLVFEVSISNRPFFCADREYAIEKSDKRIFWPPEGRKVEPPRAKNLQMAISRSFLA